MRLFATRLTAIAATLRRAWSPSSLFAASEPGVWYDPSDMSTLFQDSAGTVPVTDVEQPVGRILDKSGRGNHAFQATATSRPVLKQDASGRYYLSCDGVDDWMRTNSIDFTATDKMTVFVGLQKLNTVGTFSHVARLGTSGDNTNGFYLAAPSISGQYTFASYATAQASAFTANAIYAAPDTAVISCAADVSAPLTRLRVNGGEEIIENISTQGFGNYANRPIYIGQATSGSFNGRIYSLIIRGAQSTAQQIASAEAWVNTKTGAY